MKAFWVAGLTVAAVFGATFWLARAASHEHVIGSFTTSFSGRLKDQVHNAALAAKKLDGTVVAPGAVLSFNGQVGTWSRDQGYRKAPVSFSGTLVDSWGGGVCQTSTTLYNAGLFAGLEVIERHHHEFAASYVPPGRDAAVAYPSIDVKLRNPYAFPIRLRARVNARQLTIQVFGTGEVPPVTVSQQVSQVRDPGRFVLGSGPIGRVRNPGKPGYQVVVYRSVGARRELLSSDSYPAMSRVVEFRRPVQ